MVVITLLGYLQSHKPIGFLLGESNVCADGVHSERSSHSYNQSSPIPTSSLNSFDILFLITCGKLLKGKNAGVEKKE